MLSIPHNLVGVSERKLGLDAFFWTRLDLPYRRVLLVRDSRWLSREPLGCELKPEVSVEDQIRDLTEIAGSREYFGESRRGMPFSMLRLASLIIPYRVAEIMWEQRVNAMVLDEVEMARVIARRLLELGSLKPLGEVLWLNVSVKDRVVEDKVLGYLSRVDKAFSSSLAEVVRMCRR